MNIPEIYSGWEDKDRLQLLFNQLLIIICLEFIYYL